MFDVFKHKQNDKQKWYKYIFIFKLLQIQHMIDLCLYDIKNMNKYTLFIEVSSFTPNPNFNLKTLLFAKWISFLLNMGIKTARI